MTDLYPTPTRIKLLRAIEAGEVVRSWALRMEPHDRLDGRRVNRRVEELARAGWAAYPPMQFGGRTAVWRLTDAGREILRGAR